VVLLILIFKNILQKSVTQVYSIFDILYWANHANVGPCHHAMARFWVMDGWDSL